MGKASVSIYNYFIYQPLKDRSRKSILIQGTRVLYSDSSPKYMTRLAMWPVWKSAFSFGIYFSAQASSSLVGSSAEFAHQRCSSTAYTTNYLRVAARFTDEPATDGQAALEEATHQSGSTSMATTRSASLTYCLALSSFVLYISQCSDAHCQFDLESFPGGHQVCAQKAMHSNSSSSCKTSLCIKIAKWHTFTSVVTLEKLYSIAMCKQIPQVWRFQTKIFFETMLEPLDAAVGHHQLRECCSNYYQLSQYYRGQKDARCDVKVEGPTHSPSAPRGQQW